MAHRIRIKDIAERAGVSTGTVDRVLHDRGNVSERAKAKVLKALKELDYEPNIIASTLAYNRTIKVAVLMPQPENDLYWSYPMQGIKKALEAVRHYRVELRPCFFNLFDPVSFLEQGLKVLQESIDALLFPPIFLQEAHQILDACENSNVMVSLINTNIEGRKVLAYVGQDSFQSGVLAGKLFNIGLTQPLKTLVIHLGKGTTNAKHLLEKERGLRFYYEQKFGQPAPVLQEHFSDFEQASKLRAFITSFLETHSDLGGIFVTNSRAYHLLEVLDEPVLQRLRIIGFDLLPANLKLLNSGKISFLINQNPVQQGYLGIMNIVNKMVFKKKVNRIHHLPLDIVVHENAKYYLERASETPMFM